MYTINQERIFPDYLTFDNPIELSHSVSSNYIKFTNRQIMEIDNTSTYLVENLQHMLFEQFFFVAVIFVIVKIILEILIYSTRKSKKLMMKKWTRRYG